MHHASAWSQSNTKKTAPTSHSDGLKQFYYQPMTSSATDLTGQEKHQSLAHDTIQISFSYHKVLAFLN